MFCDSMCPLHAGFLALANIEDAVPIVHGPPGCANFRQTFQYGIIEVWPQLAPVKPYVACTNLTEQDVVLGGEDKLARAIAYVDVELKPSLIGVLNTCVAGIIQDDIDAVAESMQPKVKAQILAIHCEGFGSRGQGHGYDLVYTELVRRVMRGGLEKSPNSVNIWANMRTGGKMPGDDIFELKNLLARCGIHTNAVITGGSTVEEIRNAPKAQLNLLRCFDTGINAAKEMEKIYGVPYVLKAIPFGIDATKEWVLSAADMLGLATQAKKVVDAEADRAYKVIRPYLGTLKGKRAAICGGPNRALWQARFLNELGMEVVLVATNNMKENYPRMLVEVLQDINNNFKVMVCPNMYELEMLFTELRPDIFFGTPTEQRAVLRYGIPFIFQHNYGYFSFEGAARYVRDIHDQLINPLNKKYAEVCRDLPYLPINEEVKNIIMKGWTPMM